MLILQQCLMKSSNVPGSLCTSIYIYINELRHKTGSPRCDSRWGAWKLSSSLILLSAFSSHGVHSAYNRNEYQRISWVKCCRPGSAECQSNDGSPTFHLHDLLRESLPLYIYMYVCVCVCELLIHLGSVDITCVSHMKVKKS